MLVLGRKKDEAILIGNEIKIVVNKCGLNQISLAIHAPKDVSIVRGELVKKIQRKDSDHDNTASN